MTGRDRLNRRKRLVLLMMAVAIALIVGGVAALPLVAGAGGPLVGVAVAPGIVVLMVVVVVVQQFLFRCPWCRGNLGPLMTHRGFWRVDPKVKFCPFCGTDLDEPVDAAGWDDPVE